MNIATELVSSELRDGTRWNTVTAENWVTVHQELSLGYPRFEWLTAIHQENDDFVISTMVSTLDATESVITSVGVVGVCASIVEVYANADFYEREVIQMFGVVIGDTQRANAFDVNFAGNRLRRDFALTSRQETVWPGAVEPDVNARRRPALPPGVFAEWQS